MIHIANQTNPTIFNQETLLKTIVDDNEIKRVIIVGESGSGKSFLLTNFGPYLFTHNPDDLVFLIPLAQLNQDSLKKYLNNWLQTAQENFILPSTNSPQDCVAELLKHNNNSIWFLFDAVEEWQTNDNNRLSAFVDWLKEQKIPNHAKVVLTCQPVTYTIGEGSVLDYKSYQILPLQQEQIENIIKRCGHRYQNLQADAPQENISVSLISALKNPENQYVRTLCSTIINLLLLCRSYQVGHLPKNRTEIYEKFVNDHPGNQIYFPLLRILAKKAIQANNSLISPCTPEEKKGCQSACTDGWLKKVFNSSEDNIQYTFTHPSYRSFFAAQAISNWEFFVRYFQNNNPRLFLQEWRETILFWMGRRDIDENKKYVFLTHLVYFTDNYGMIFKGKASLLADEIIKEFVEFKTFHNHQELREIIDNTKETLTNLIKNDYTVFKLERKRRAKRTKSRFDRKFNLNKQVRHILKIAKKLDKDSPILWKAFERLGEIGSSGKISNKNKRLITAFFIDYLLPDDVRILLGNNPNNNTSQINYLDLLISQKDSYLFLKALYQLNKLHLQQDELTDILLDKYNNQIDEYLKSEPDIKLELELYIQDTNYLIKTDNFSLLINIFLQFLPDFVAGSVKQEITQNETALIKFIIKFIQTFLSGNPNPMLSKIPKITKEKNSTIISKNSQELQQFIGLLRYLIRIQKILEQKGDLPLSALIYEGIKEFLVNKLASEILPIFNMSFDKQLKTGLDNLSYGKGDTQLTLSYLLHTINNRPNSIITDKDLIKLIISKLKQYITNTPIYKSPRKTYKPLVARNYLKVYKLELVDYMFDSIISNKLFPDDTQLNNRYDLERFRDCFKTIYYASELISYNDFSQYWHSNP